MNEVSEWSHGQVIRGGERSGSSYYCQTYSKRQESEKRKTKREKQREVRKEERRTVLGGKEEEEAGERKILSVYLQLCPLFCTEEVVIHPGEEIMKYDEILDSPLLSRMYDITNTSQHHKEQATIDAECKYTSSRCQCRPQFNKHCARKGMKVCVEEREGGGQRMPLSLLPTPGNVTRH